MSNQNDDAEKSHEPPPHKLEEARKKGALGLAAELNTAASNAGL